LRRTTARRWLHAAGYMSTSLECSSLSIDSHLEVGNNAHFYGEVMALCATHLREFQQERSNKEMKRFQRLGFCAAAALLFALPGIAATSTVTTPSALTMQRLERIPALPITAKRPRVRHAGTMDSICYDNCSAFADIYEAGCISGGGDPFDCFVLTELFLCACNARCDGKNPAGLCQ